MQSLKVYGIEFKNVSENFLDIKYQYKEWILCHDKKFDMWTLSFDDKNTSFSIYAPSPKQAISNYICHRIKHA